MNLLKFLRRTWWGADPSILLILYKSFVRSIIDYGCFIYFSHKKNEVEALEKIQFAAIRYALGYRISTPTNLLIAESKLTYTSDVNFYVLHTLAKLSQTKAYQLLNPLDILIPLIKNKNPSSKMYKKYYGIHEDN